MTKTIVHSCCPKKVDIYPPAFARTAVYVTSKGSLEEWTCKGCKAVIMIGPDK